MKSSIFSRVKSRLKTLIRREKPDLVLGEKNVFVFLAPDYGNYGDIAISYAQRMFLRDVLPEYNVVEIPVSKFYNYLLFLKKMIKRDDFVAVMGGGNMGDLYEYYEEIRRQTIKSFPNNLIISFPQTISFSDSKSGRRSLKRTIKIYSKHKGLLLFAREKKSFVAMKKYFCKNSVFLMPDMVFYLKDRVGKNELKGDSVGICLRTDAEKLVQGNLEEKVKDGLSGYSFKNIKTHTKDENIIFDRKDEQLLEFLEEIKELKLLVTDRLHGMIFSYITGTPCIVFDNKNHKVSESYNAWVRGCGFIRLVSEKEIGEINRIVAEVLGSDRTCEKNLGDEFERAGRIIRAEVDKIENEGGVTR